MRARVIEQDDFDPTLLKLVADEAGFLSKDIALVDAPLKSGYTYGLAAGAGAVPGPVDCNGTATNSAFYGSAVPLAFGSTGRRSFAVNAENTMWELDAAVAPSEPFSAPASPIK